MSIPTADMWLEYQGVAVYVHVLGNSIHGSSYCDNEIHGLIS